MRADQFPWLLAARAGCVALAAWWSSSCAPSGFQDESQLQGGVRVLASSADAPYAAPGQSVRVDLLAYDGRPAAERAANPVRLFWFPFVCENPSLDAYYACFSQFANPDSGTLGHVVVDDGAPGVDAGAEADSGADAGAEGDADAEADSDAGAGADGDASGADSDTDANLSPGTPIVSSFQFVVPSDAVSSHPAVAGTTPYGLLIAFNVACAGQLQLLPLSGNPQSPPLGCADSSGHLLDPSNYVFGYTRVYAYLPDAGIDGVNTNPVIDCVDVRGSGAPIDGGAPSTTCAGSFPLEGVAPSMTIPTVHIPACATGQSSCPHIDIGPHVTGASWEPAGNGLHEEIWVDYYSSFGGFTHNSKLLYDPMIGSLGPPSTTDTEFDSPAPPSASDGFVWMVVHDNRGGTAWVTIPIHLDGP
jgi:hypothetical protein